MKINKIAIRVAFILAFGAIATTSHAANLANGDLLTITAGIPVFDSNGYSVNVSAGSYFGFDGNMDYKINGSEKYALSPGMDGGLKIGITQHVLGPGDTNAQIDTWSFFGYSGHDYTAAAPVGGTATGVDLSGWHFHWRPFNSYTGLYDDVDIGMGGGAWQPLNCVSLGCAGYTFTSGIARLQWDGVYGHGYTLDYSAAVPAGHPSGFGGVPFYWHLEGTIQAVPIPAAVWLFGSGLVGLFGLARRQRNQT